MKRYVYFHSGKRDAKVHHARLSGDEVLYPACGAEPPQYHGNAFQVRHRQTVGHEPCHRCVEIRKKDGASG